MNGVARIANEFKVKGHELIRKEVKRSGTSSMIYLPAKWEGETVAVIRLTSSGVIVPRRVRLIQTYEIWETLENDKHEFICECKDEYDAQSKLELLESLEPERVFKIMEMTMDKIDDDD